MRYLQNHWRTIFCGMRTFYDVLDHKLLFFFNRWVISRQQKKHEMLTTVFLSLLVKLQIHYYLFTQFYIDSFHFSCHVLFETVEFYNYRIFYWEPRPVEFTNHNVPVLLDDNVHLSLIKLCKKTDARRRFDPRWWQRWVAPHGLE